MIAGAAKTERAAVVSTAAHYDETVLAVEDLVIDGILEGVSFALRKGEVLGIAGLLGAGRTELLSAIYGTRHDCSGVVRVNGTEVPNRNPAVMLKLGIAMTPEDRKDAGIVPLLGVDENIMLMARSAGTSAVIDGRKEKEVAASVIDRLDLAAATPGQAIGSLSGGNQQKGVIGRCLAADMSILLLDEPTRGIDVGAKRALYDLMRGLAESGISTIFVSSELEELSLVCDRVLVLRDQKIRDVVAGADASSERLLALTMKADTEEER